MVNIMLSNTALKDAMVGEPDATPREIDAVRRALQRLAEADYIVCPQKYALVRREAEENSDLPAPRLQLRWDGTDICHYEMVILLAEHDIRRERDEGTASRLMAVPLGCTRVTRGKTGDDPMRFNPATKDWEVETPYRDGAHIAWDAHQLGLRAFAVWGSRYTELQPKVPGSIEVSP